MVLVFVEVSITAMHCWVSLSLNPRTDLKCNDFIEFGVYVAQCGIVIPAILFENCSSSLLACHKPKRAGLFEIWRKWPLLPTVCALSCSLLPFMINDPALASKFDVHM